MPFVCLRRAHLAGGDLPSAVGGMPVKDFVLGGLTDRVQGRVVWFEKSQGPTRKMDLTPLSVLAGSCKFRSKSQKKFKNCKTYIVVLCVTRTTISTKHVYTFEL
jgi:hypothetical protein